MKNALRHIIVQAGGRGSRLGALTHNKPKALVPVENLPILFHLVQKYPDSEYIIISDYKRDVMHGYLNRFLEAKYTIVDANGTGTCAGIRQALEFIPENDSFMLIWSDLILPKDYQLPDALGNYVGISQTFECRWTFDNGIFKQAPSTKHGVAGLFIFENKRTIEGVPPNGEFVAWLDQRRIDFLETGLAGTREFGLLSEYNKLRIERTRPFNRLTEDEGILIKEGLNEQGLALAKLEADWYRAVSDRGFKSIPTIYDYNPIRMEKICGKNVYEYTDLSRLEKQKIIDKLVMTLDKLHALECVPVDLQSIKDTYLTKTFDRLNSIEGLIPLSNNKYIIINGRRCRNVFLHKRELVQAFDSYVCSEFALIHGDCTFSNTMLDAHLDPIYIDPRGYFGKTRLYGDPLYDWAKLYYSIVGNYDRFNLREFKLDISDSGVALQIASNGWEDLEEYFLQKINIDVHYIKLIHAVIWLSLTTYAWHDYDSICGAFYNGLYYLEEALS